MSLLREQTWSLWKLLPLTVLPETWMEAVRDTEVHHPTISTIQYMMPVIFEVWNVLDCYMLLGNATIFRIATDQLMLIKKSTITYHDAYFGLFWVHVSVHMTWCSNLKAPRKMQDYLHHGSCMLGSTNAYQAYCNLAETSSPIWGQGVWWFGHPRIRAWTLPAWTSPMETMRWETHSWLPSRYFDSSKCWYLKRSEWDLWTGDIKNDERTQASSTNCQQMMTPIISWKNWLPSRLERACCELWLQSQGHGRTVENIREASTVISIIAGTPGIIWRLNTHWAGVQAATRQTRSDSSGHEGL